MTRIASKPLVFVAGLLVGLAVALVGGSAGPGHKAVAEVGTGVPGLGYQISSYGTGSSGAYVVDGQTGDVYVVSGVDKPRLLGRATGREHKAPAEGVIIEEKSQAPGETKTPR